MGEYAVVTCPDCKREWPGKCEQALCISMFNMCIVCKFGANGKGTHDEFKKFETACADKATHD